MKLQRRHLLAAANRQPRGHRFQQLGPRLSHQADHRDRAVRGGRPDRRAGPRALPEDERELGQQLVVENIGGAGGTIGVNKVAKANSDGYTLLFTHMGTLAVNIALYKSLPYDSQKDLEPIGLGGTNPMVLVTKKDLPAKTFAEFLAYVRANQKKVQYGMAGIGAASHLGGLMLNSMMKVEVLEIPYKGTGPALNDLVSGQFDYMVDQAVNVLPQINSGNIKALGVSTLKRLPQLPDVPTIDECRPQGLRGHDLERLLRAQGHGEGPDRQDQRRAGQDDGRCHRQQAPDRARRRPAEQGRGDARGAAHAAPGVDRQVGAGGEGRRREAGVVSRAGRESAGSRLRILPALVPVLSVVLALPLRLGAGIARVGRRVMPSLPLAAKPGVASRVKARAAEAVARIFSRVMIVIRRSVSIIPVKSP